MWSSLCVFIAETWNVQLVIDAVESVGFLFGVSWFRIGLLFISPLIAIALHSGSRYTIETRRLAHCRQYIRMHFWENVWTANVRRTHDCLYICRRVQYVPNAFSEIWMLVYNNYMVSKHEAANDWQTRKYQLKNTFHKHKIDSKVLFWNTLTAPTVMGIFSCFNFRTMIDYLAERTNEHWTPIN